MDIFIEISYMKQSIKSCLCGIQDYAVMLEQGKEKEETVRFAVRFPFWAVRRFLNLDMSDLYNQTIDLDLLMLGCNVTFEELFYCRSVDISGYSPVSQRQLERLFKQEIGISIKRTASLIRYQNVWREVVRQERFDIQKAVGRYGYADQSHLLNEFKRLHGLYLSQAKQEALERR